MASYSSIISLFAPVSDRLIFHPACKALDGLIMLGARVRDRVRLKLSPVETLHREIESYYRWSIEDAGLSNIEHIPALSIAAANPDESVASVIGRLTDQVHDRGNQYRALWLDEDRCTVYDNEQYYFHDLPTLYGVAINYTIVSFLTYDVAKPGEALKCLASFNFQQVGQDVWNALAISILFIRARNYLLELEDEGELGELIQLAIEDLDP